MVDRRARVVVAAALLANGLLPTLAQAQVYDRVAPKMLPNNPAVTLPVPPAPPLSPSGELLLPSLKGLIFVADRSAVRNSGMPAGSVGANGIAAAGLPLLAERGFVDQVAPFIGAKLTRADLGRLTQLVSDWYRRRDQPFIAVVVPPQNIDSGVIQVVVMQYRIGKVHPEGNHWFASPLLIEQSGLVPGRTLTLSGVQADLDWLNSNPFRTVTAIFKPAEEPGGTDVVLATEDRLPLRVYSSYDNAGVASLGRGEWSVGATWGDLFGLDQQLAYQYTRTTSGLFDAHSASWTAPLPWRDKIVVFGSFERERPNLGLDFNDPGRSGQAGVRYVHTLPRVSTLNGIGLTHDLQIGYDFKSANNSLEFGGTQVFASQIEVDQIPIMYDATETDRYGQTQLENRAVYSPGGLTGANTTAAFQVAVPRSSAAYFYDRIELTRSTLLPARFLWVARVVLQLANGNLPYSEQLGAGGAASVRGYYTDAAIGSRGLLVSNEILLPAFSALHLISKGSSVDDRLQLGVFQDWGHVSQADLIADRVNHASLSSLGLDAHLTFDRYVEMRFDVGRQLMTAPTANHRGTFADFMIIVGF